MNETEFYKIPGSNIYRINSKFEIIDYNGTKLITQKTSVLLTLYGITKKWNLNWLFYAAYFDIDTIPNVKEHLSDIIFKNINSSYLRYKINKIMVFKNPIYYGIGNEARIIPNYHKYAITKDGSIINTSTNTLVDTYTSDHSGYRLVTIYSSVNRKSCSVKLHRLLALAYIPNNDYVLRPMINHINLKVYDNRIENLEWVSNQENSIHAVESGANKTARPILVLDAFTKEVKRYRSAGAFFKEIGFGSTSRSNLFGNNPGFLIKNRYEAKFEDDTKEWYYLNRNPPLIETRNTASRYIIIVVDKHTGDEERFINIKNFLLKYPIPGDNVGDIEVKLIKARISYPDKEFDYEIVGSFGPYYVLNVDTNEEVEYEKISDVALAIGYSDSYTRSFLKRKLKVRFNNKFVIDTSPINKEAAKNYPRFPTEAIRVELYNANNHHIRNFTRLAGLCSSLSIELDDIIPLIDKDGYCVLEKLKLSFRLVYE